MKMIDVKRRTVLKFGARFARAAWVSRVSISQSQLMAAQSESLDIEALLDSVADDTMTQLMSELSSAASSYIGDREALKMPNFFDSASTSGEGTMETRTCHWEADDEPSTSQERQCMSRVMFSEKSVSKSKLLQAEVTNQAPNVLHLQMQPEEADNKKTKKKQRWLFTLPQKQELEAAFKENMYPSKWRLTQLSERLAVPVPTLRVWFQNKRWRLRRSFDLCDNQDICRNKEKLQDRNKEPRREKILLAKKMPISPYCASITSASSRPVESKAGNLSFATSSGLTQSACVLNKTQAENWNESVACNLSSTNLMTGWNALPFYWPQTHLPLPVSAYSSYSYPLSGLPSSPVCSGKSSIPCLIPPVYSSTCFPQSQPQQPLACDSQQATVDLPTSKQGMQSTETMFPSPPSSGSHMCYCTSCLYAGLNIPSSLSAWSICTPPMSAPIPVGLMFQRSLTESTLTGSLSPPANGMFGWGVPPTPVSPFFPASTMKMIPSFSFTTSRPDDLIAMHHMIKMERASSTLRLGSSLSSPTEASSSGTLSPGSCHGEDLSIDLGSNSEKED